MAVPETHGLQDVTYDEYLRAVETLQARDETIRLGGVTSRRVAEHVGVVRATATDHLSRLVEAGELERVTGLTEYGPTASYRPSGGEE